MEAVAITTWRSAPSGTGRAVHELANRDVEDAAVQTQNNFLLARW